MTSTPEPGADPAIDLADPAAAAAVLGSVPLLAGLAEQEILALASLVRVRRLEDGEILWREGEPAKTMAFLLSGQVSVSIALPGRGSSEVATLSAGETLGEIPLVDGGDHSATVRASGPVTLLALDRVAFLGLAARGQAVAWVMKRRIAEVQCRRLRRQLSTLAGALPAGSPPASSSSVDLEPAPAPDQHYLRRLIGYMQVDAPTLEDLFALGSFVACPPRTQLVWEGQPTTHCYLTINGAVERVLVRGEQRIRVALAGPGLAFGYESLVDGEPVPMSAIARERSVLFALPSDALGNDDGGGDGSTAQGLLEIVARDLSTTLRQALRPQARLAVSL